jgi:hypothetical protein
MPPDPLPGPADPAAEPLDVTALPPDPLAGPTDPAAKAQPPQPAAAGADLGDPAAKGAVVSPPDEAGVNTGRPDDVIAGRPGDAEPGTEDPPDVGLSDTEVADVLSGRVIPIGAFFGAPQAVSAGQADEEREEAPGATFLTDVGRIVASWAEERHLGITSAAGIGIALAVCAAAWFSAGSSADIVRGVTALWLGYLILRTGQWLALQADQLEAEQQPAARVDTYTAFDESTATDPDAGIADARRSASPHGLDRRRTHARVPLRAGPAPWLAALGGAVAECGVYAGLAAGAVAERWGGVWTLATAVLSLVAVRNLMSACSTPPGLSEQSASAVRRFITAVLTMPIGGRVLLIGVVAPFWGARTALLALLDWAIISIGYGVAGRAAVGVTAWALHGGQPAGGQPSHTAARSKLVRLRDDGALARALGLLVRGHLIPLPPALLGLAAISALAFLGLHGLPGVLLIAPAVVMLLAAPGSAHPHTGRLDWLVPVILLGAQCLYLTATGLAARVPGPVIFALIAAIMVRYTDLAWPGRPVQLARRRDRNAEPVERGTTLGWEGRMLFAGLSAAMGIATVGYLVLAAYLGLLVCVKAVASFLAPQPEARP